MVYLPCSTYVLLQLLSPRCSFFFTIIAQRVTLHTDRIKANFDWAFNFLNYVAMLPSSIDNDACTFKEATSI